MTGLGLAGLAAGAALGLGGVALIRRAWRSASPGAPTLLGWALLAAAVAPFSLEARWDKALALALLAPSLAAYGFVAANAQVRPARQRPVRAAAELPDRSGEAVWRTLARTLLGGPGAGAAAVLLAAAWALKGAGSSADRLGVALLLAPILWAAGLTWATTDARLARIAGGLGALSCVGLTWALL